MANCKYIKLKLNHKLECKLTGKIITWDQCKNCKLREYNLTNIKLQNKQNNFSFYKKTLKIKNKIGKSKNISKKVRELIHERDNHICQICYQYGNHLHHIKTKQERPDLINEPINIITLCFNCHINKVTGHEKEYEKMLTDKIRNLYQ